MKPDLSNPFAAHAAGLKELQAAMSAGDAAPDSGSVIYPVSPANTRKLPAIVQPFELKQIQSESGGWSPTLVGTVLIRKADLPHETVFKTAQPINVVQPFSTPRPCKIFEIFDKYTFWELTLLDINQGA